MPKTISKALESRLLRSNTFLRHLEDLHSMTGVEVLYLGALGEERLRVPRSTSSPLRKLDHLVPAVAKIRMENRQAILVGLPPKEEAPWKEIIHPLRIEKEIIGFLVLSAWRPLSYPLERVKTLWSSWASQGESISWFELENLLTQLPNASEDQLDAWSRHLRLIADDSLRQLEHPNQPHLIPEHLPAMIQKACHRIQTSFRERITLEEVASYCGVSPEHLSRTFHQSTGLRFREYVAETRIQEVCMELEKTSDSIGVIAQRNGFSTLSRFNHTFKDIMGLTPREWRKQRFRMLPKKRKPL